MFDFFILYKGKVIGNIKSETKRKATNLAKKMYGSEVTVEKV